MRASQIVDHGTRLGQIIEQFDWDPFALFGADKKFSVCPVKMIGRHTAKAFGDADADIATCDIGVHGVNKTLIIEIGRERRSSSPTSLSTFTP